MKEIDGIAQKILWDKFRKKCYNLTYNKTNLMDDIYFIAMRRLNDILTDDLQVLKLNLNKTDIFE